MFKDTPKKIKLIIFILIGLFVLSVIAGGYFYLKQNSGKDSRPWYAIFLDNNQIYYGHISSKNDPYIKLTDIYYLQQAADQQAEQDKKPEEKKPSLSLIKFASGNEAYGPKDEMYINKDHILRFEPLKDDSEVVKLIRDYQNKK